MYLVQSQSQKFYSEEKFTKNIKIFLQLYMIMTDLFSCHQVLVLDQIVT